MTLYEEIYEVIALARRNNLDLAAAAIEDHHRKEANHKPDGTYWGHPIVPDPVAIAAGQAAAACDRAYEDRQAYRRRGRRVRCG